MPPSRFPARAPLRREGARPCPLAQARAHDGWRRDRGKRTGQGLGVYGAPTGGLNAMNLPRRQFLHLAAGVAAVPSIPRVANAQAYPTRTVRIIVGFAPGQAMDLVTRI